MGSKSEDSRGRKGVSLLKIDNNHTHGGEEKCSRLGSSKLFKERLEVSWPFYQFVTFLTILY
jgi:hypothetical protein